jgi:ABC-type amino acid transport substrate-binding protein
LQKNRGQWQGQAVELWELIARREGLAYLMSGYANPRSLLEAARTDQVDIGVGCLTMAPERVGKYRFSLPFQERGLALMLPAEAGANSLRLLSTLVNTELLKVIGGYLLAIGLISSVVWLDEHRAKDSSKREQLRRFALIYQVLASGPGTNMIVTRTRGHALVLLAWLVRIIGASMIVSTITLDALREPAARGFQPRRLTDLIGLRIAVRPGSVSEHLLKIPPLAGRVKLVNLSALDKGPELLLQGNADGVLADEQQLVYVLEQTPPEQRSRLRLALKDSYRESQAFVYSPSLDTTMATRLDRAISQAKRDGLLP